MPSLPSKTSGAHASRPPAPGRVFLPLLLSAALLAACASPGGIRPQAKLLQPQELGLPAAAPLEWPAERWWAAWGDRQLEALIDAALAGSPGLQQAQARVRQAQAAIEGADAARAPQLGAQLDLTRQRYTEHGLVPAPVAGSTRDSGTLQLAGSWELDLFGRQRAQLDTAIGQARAAQAELQAARQLLAANVASAYVVLARLQEQQALADAALRQREQVLALVRQRIDAGLDTTVELRQAEGVIAQTRVEREALAEQVQRTRHALAELTGRAPQATAALVAQPLELPAMALPEALPADLLGRRADVVAARWRVEAAGSQVEAARAQFYPNVNLTAFVGLSSLGLDRLLDLGSRQAGAGPAIRLPIFDTGRLRANLQGRTAEVDAAVAGYNAAVLRALHEAADEIAALRTVDRQLGAQAEALQAAEQAFELAVQRYRAGLGNFLVVLTAESNVLAQRRAEAELRSRALTERIALIRALGGGWRGGVEAPAPAVPPLPSATPVSAASAAQTAPISPAAAL